MPKEDKVGPWQTRAGLPHRDGICYLALAYSCKWKCGPKIVRSSEFSREIGNLAFYFKPPKISVLAPNLNLFKSPVKQTLVKTELGCLLTSADRLPFGSPEWTCGRGEVKGFMSWGQVLREQSRLLSFACMEVPGTQAAIQGTLEP